MFRKFSKSDIGPFLGEYYQVIGYSSSNSRIAVNFGQLSHLDYLEENNLLNALIMSLN